MTANKGFWDRWAGAYDGAMAASGGLYEQIANRIKKSLNREMNVLELACGTGLLSDRLAGSVKLLEATDFSEAMIRQAKAKNYSSRLHFSVQDATALPYATASFDAVVIANALHIMPQPELALEEIRRVLKPGGALYAPTFVHGRGAGFRLRARIMALAGFKVYSKWAADEFAAYVSGHGFKVTRTELLGGKIAPLCYLEAVLPANDEQAHDSFWSDRERRVTNGPAQ